MSITLASKNPFFSIIVNCLNGERFLKEALDSVFAQTFTDWELIFYDSGSKDRSLEIASSYGDQIKIFGISEPVPLGQARQSAIEQATGNYLAFLDVDDIWLPEKLQLQYDALKNNDFHLCYGASEFINEQGKKLFNSHPIHSSGYLFKDYLSQVEGSFCTVVINRNKLIGKGIKFNPTLRSSCEEDLILRFLAYDGRGIVINQVIAKYRVLPGSVTHHYSYRLAEERFITLESLASENPDISEVYPRAFASAKARGYYYKAKYFFEIDQYSKALDELKIAKQLDKSYNILFLLGVFPGLWKFTHRHKAFLAKIWLSTMV
jgi:glycosyltransferase involved in cell wall biosynthesis